MQKFFKSFKGHFFPSSENAYRPHLLRKPWLLFFLSIILTAEGFYIASRMGGEEAYRFLSAVLSSDVIALTNAEREIIGTQPLKENALLSSAAQHKAEDMARKGYFAHVGPDGKEPWAWVTEAGYNYRFAGENLAVRFDNSSDVVAAWMASPTHRANIVKPVYEEIGIGIAEGVYQGSPAVYIVQYFGSEVEPTVATETTDVVPSESPSGVAGAQTEEEPVPTVSSTLPPPIAAPEESTAEQREEFTMREAAQAFLRANEASQTTTLWVIGGVATLLVILIAFAFFIHMEIQPGEMLASGSVVALIALTLLSFNTLIYSPNKDAGSAAAIQAVSSGVYIGEEGASTEAMVGDNGIAEEL